MCLNLKSLKTYVVLIYQHLNLIVLAQNCKFYKVYPNKFINT